VSERDESVDSQSQSLDHTSSGTQTIYLLMCTYEAFSSSGSPAPHTT
jgi:hypothetical protein